MIGSPQVNYLSEDLARRSGWIERYLVVSLRYKSDSIAFSQYPQHPVGYIYVVLPEGDDIPNGKFLGVAFSDVNGIHPP